MTRWHWTLPSYISPSYMWVTWEAQRRRPCHNLKPLDFTDWQLLYHSSRRNAHRGIQLSIHFSFVYWHTLSTFTKVAQLFSEFTPARHLTRHVRPFNFAFALCGDLNFSFSKREKVSEKGENNKERAVWLCCCLVTDSIQLSWLIGHVQVRLNFPAKRERC